MLRRDALRWLLGGAAAAAASPLLRERRARADATSRPRFYLQIIPGGGMDAIYTTDPKQRSEVEPTIDVPFEAKDIVEASGTRLGPCFRALARWMPRMAVVNAFRQNSANHTSGLAHVTRFKSNTGPTTPTLLDVLGARRQDEATGAISMGYPLASGYSPDFLGEPGKVFFGIRPSMLDQLDQADAEDLAALSAALRREARPLTGARASASERKTAENLIESAELCTGVAHAPHFAPDHWDHPKEKTIKAGRSLQRAMWLFQNKLARCATVCVTGLAYDTHYWNTTLQPPLNDYLAFLLDKLFGELDARSVDGKPLAQQTVVIVGSEIGRFPRLNHAHGKDHFPQVSHVFFGPGLATGATYGGTDREMVAMPVSLATGRPEKSGHLLTVDDVGTTLLALDGAAPELYGYTGEHLRFLTA